MCLLKNKSCDRKGIKRGYEARTWPDPGHVCVRYVSGTETCPTRPRYVSDMDRLVSDQQTEFNPVRTHAEHVMGRVG